MVGVDGDKVELSLRHSRTRCGDSEEEVKGDFLGQLLLEEDMPPDPEISSLEDVLEGTVLSGYVKATTGVGAFVQ